MKMRSLLTILLSKMGYVNKNAIAQRVRVIKIHCVSLERTNLVLSASNQVKDIQLEEAKQEIVLLNKKIEEANNKMLAIKEDAISTAEKKDKLAKQALTAYELAFKNHSLNKQC